MFKGVSEELCVCVYLCVCVLVILNVYILGFVDWEVCVILDSISQPTVKRALCSEYCLSLYVRVCAYALCVCVCVREKERERERNCSKCVCVCVCGWCVFGTDFVWWGVGRCVMSEEHTC